jgi:glycine cleavage system H protein
MSIPHDRKYSEEHVWVKRVENGLLVGITDFAQSNLGELLYLELPQVGESLTQGSCYGTAESSKAVNDLFTPIDCVVAEVNSNLSDNPGLVNESAYEDAWMIRVTEHNEEDLKPLLDAEAYAAFIRA